MVWKRFEGEVPDGHHLDQSRDSDGALRGTLRRDSDNHLVGHIELHEVYDGVVEAQDDEPGDHHGGSSNLDPDLVILGGLALVGLTVGAVSSVVGASRRKKTQRRELEWRFAEARIAQAQAAATNPRVAAPAGWYDDGSGRLRWWDGQEWTAHFYAGNPRVGALADWYDDGSGRLRWWDGQEWTAHFHEVQRHVSTRSPAVSGDTPVASSREVALGTPTVTMSSAEWQERVRAMFLARAISDVQWRLLSNALIQDADGALLGWQSELRKLTPEEFSDQISSVLATNSAARSRALEAAHADWYDDGSGRQRWWDGQAWTDHFRVDEVRVLAGPRAATPSGWYDDGSRRQRS